MNTACRREPAVLCGSLPHECHLRADLHAAADVMSLVTGPFTHVKLTLTARYRTIPMPTGAEYGQAERAVLQQV